MASVDRFVFLFREINRRLRLYEDILALIGLYYVVKKATVLSCKFVEGIRTFVVPRLFRADLTKYGKWAVVTGATDGIGKAYARELASRGLNIVLISRNRTRLETVSEELEKDFGVKTLFIQADFSAGREIYSTIKEELDKVEIGILVNNVGVMYDNPCYFLNLPEEKLWELVNINVASVLMMTRIVLPQMLSKKGGYIVNMSSIASFYPLPLMAAYSASKIFVDWFSRALGYEYRHKGIIVQSLIPSYVSTKLVKFSDYLQRPSMMIPDAITFCRSAVATLGYTNRTTGYWSNGVQHALFECIPLWLWYSCSWCIQKALYNIKKLE